MTLERNDEGGNKKEGDFEDFLLYDFSYPDFPHNDYYATPHVQYRVR